MKWLIINEERIINLSLVKNIKIEDRFVDAELNGRFISFDNTSTFNETFMGIEFKSEEARDIAFSEIKIFLNTAMPVLYLTTKEKK